jgi:hypothetical protein
MARCFFLSELPSFLDHSILFSIIHFLMIAIQTSPLFKICFIDSHALLMRLLPILSLYYSTFYSILHLLFFTIPPLLLIIFMDWACLYHFLASKSSFERGILKIFFHYPVPILKNLWNIWILRIIIIHLNLFIFHILISKSSFKY